MSMGFTYGSAMMEALKRKNETVEPLPEDFDTFKEKEDGLVNHVGGFLTDLVPEKYKKKATAILAAFSIFASASSAFAESEEPNIKEKLFPENYAAEMEKGPDKDEIAPKGFDIKKIADKITISLGGRIEEVSEFKGESIPNSFYGDIVLTDFYKGLSVAENNNVSSILSSAIYGPEGAKSYFEFLTSQRENLDDRQKILLAQRLGGLLDPTYNYDMSENGDHVEISANAILQAVKEGGKSGICGNLSTFVMETLKALGMEAFLQSGSAGGTNDVFTGVVAEINGKKTDRFFDILG